MSGFGVANKVVFQKGLPIPGEPQNEHQNNQSWVAFDHTMWAVHCAFVLHAVYFPGIIFAFA